MKTLGLIVPPGSPGTVRTVWFIGESEELRLERPRCEIFVRKEKKQKPFRSDQRSFSDDDSCPVMSKTLC